MGRETGSGRTLANLLKSRTAPVYISELLDEHDIPIRGQVHTHAHLTKFFKELYTSSHSTLTTDLETYLDTIQLFWLTPGHREYLDQPFTVEDIITVIKSLPAGKAPGLDGLTSLFYKTFAEALAPRLLDVYQESLDSGRLPQSMREAGLIALLKPDKPPSRCDSYRPLSLMNIDTKILAKLIANRLQPLLPLLTRPDQSGFIPSRSTAQNIRTFFSVLHQIDPNLPSAAVFLDATKAFDSLEWSYLFTLLPRFGFSSKFINLIKLLYTDPTARLSANGLVSDSFPVTRGTRQGCPLSPLLFALAMEPLSARIRQHYASSALIFTERSLTISTYADDITLYVQHPDDNLHPLLRELLRYGGFSGITINWGKSAIMPLTNKHLNMTLEFPLQWADAEVKYLGIWLSRDVQQL